MRFVEKYAGVISGSLMVSAIVGGLVLVAGFACGKSASDQPSAVTNTKGLEQKAQDTPVMMGGSGGTVSGTVKFDGTPPAPKKITPDKDQSACAHEIVSDSLLVDADSKGIKWAFVEVVNSGNFADDGKTSYALDQKGCTFLPHILVVPPKAAVELHNSDGVLHNVKSSSMLNSAFNEGIPANSKVSKKFMMPEKIKVSCDVHSWMGAYIIVTKNAGFAVTDEKGNFEIKDVPVGKYKIKVWHEVLGTQEKDIEVKDNEKTDASFQLKEK